MAWISNDGSTNKVEYIDKVEAIRLGISYHLLLDAVSDGVGSIDINGCYPCDQKDHRRIKEGRFPKIGLPIICLQSPRDKILSELGQVITGAGSLRVLSIVE